MIYNKYFFKYCVRMNSGEKLINLMGKENLKKKKIK